ncbi:trypsin-1 isoform X2 [Anabrus simplex]|uniref:trypsin-1 isoform X2 n=1 Tax=Anabrus simplex TaxID=316456 RepID=UPI0034DD2D13
MCSVIRTFLLITVAISRLQGRENNSRSTPGQVYKSATTNSCECGTISDTVGTRIVGGSVTQPHRYPWMVAILNSGKMHCGGSLINDRYVLTAGHCLNWARKEDLSVILGMHDRVTMEEGTEKLVDIDKLIVHEQFSSDYLHDTEDIGLIRLKSPVHYNRYISPVCLPKPGSDYTHQIALVTGWGRTAQNGNPSRYLRKASVKILLQSDCRNTTIGEHIMDTMMCAYEFETDACQIVPTARSLISWNLKIDAMNMV